MPNILVRLLDLCRENAFSFRLEYSEAEDNFELEVWGIGKGEKFYVKRAKFLENAVEYIEEQVKAFKEGLPST